jgi:hypothetical protein
MIEVRTVRNAATPNTAGWIRILPFRSLTTMTRSTWDS